MSHKAFVFFGVGGSYSSENLCEKAKETFCSRKQENLQLKKINK